MSSFRDTFTKGEQQNILGYDSSASLYFGGCVLLCVLAPWTYVYLRNRLYNSPTTSREEKTKQKGCSCSLCANAKHEPKDRSKRKALDKSTIIQFILLLALWIVWFWVAIRLSGADKISTFDPFEVLEIDSGATTREIRKAYRSLSLKYHPDRNPDDPGSAAKFILIAKAYQTLTDEVARANFEKYGNPDGPGFMRIGIGLPQFLVAKENQLIILLVFFSLILVVIPGIFFWYYRNQRKYAPNGVLMETVQLLTHCMKEQSRIRQLSELFVASAEVRDSTSLKPSDNKEMAALVSSIDDSGGKRLFGNSPIIVRNHYLILGHMQRLHHLMSPTLLEELHQMLQHTELITECAVDIAAFRGWDSTIQSALELRACLIQACPSGAPQFSLLQVPHFTLASIKHCLKGKNSVKGVKGFLAQSMDERKGLVDLSPDQIADVAAFCASAPSLSMEVAASVIGETTIVEGDVITLTITLTRHNLREGEMVGHVHAPLFPKSKDEEWWIFVWDKTTGKLLSLNKCRSPDYQPIIQCQFREMRHGKQTFQVSAYCDSYIGFDVGTSISINVLPESQAERGFVLHPDDDALDAHPTLFQQLLGAGDHAESSSVDGAAEHGGRDDSTDSEDE